MKSRFIIAGAILFIFSPVFSQIQKAPLVKEGEGPFAQLILRGGILINGTGTPAYGPVDIVIENNRIAAIVAVGFPGVKIDPERRPKLKAGGHELNVEGKYILPGLIDMHGHIGGTEQGTPAEYVFKLWMANGIITSRTWKRDRNAQDFRRRTRCGA